MNAMGGNPAGRPGREQHRSPEEPRLSERYDAFFEKVKGKLSPEEAEEFGALNEAQKGVEKMSVTDDLTGLLNRRGFFGEVRRLEALSRREELITRLRIPSALLFIDLDGFKKVNDACGHAGGDHGLMLVAESMRKAVREYDVLARIGGDEFGVFIHGNDEEEAAKIAERIRTAIEHVSDDLRAAYPAYAGGLSASIGIAGLDEAKKALGDAFTIEDALRYADYAAYVMKAAGKEGELTLAAALDLDSGGRFKEDFLSGKELPRS